MLVIDLPDGRIVPGLDANEQLTIKPCRRLP
jgi:hypothetical protein